MAPRNGRHHERTAGAETDSAVDPSVGSAARAGAAAQAGGRRAGGAARTWEARVPQYPPRPTVVHARLFAGGWPSVRLNSRSRSTSSAISRPNRITTVGGQRAQLAECEITSAARLGDHHARPQPFGAGRFPCLSGAPPAQGAPAAQGLRLVVGIGGCPPLRIGGAYRDVLIGTNRQKRHSCSHNFSSRPRADAPAVTRL